MNRIGFRNGILKLKTYIFGEKKSTKYILISLLSFSNFHICSIIWTCSINLNSPFTLTVTKRQTCFSRPSLKSNEKKPCSFLLCHSLGSFSGFLGNMLDYYPYRAFGGQNKIVYSTRFVRRAILFKYCPGNIFLILPRLYVTNHLTLLYVYDMS